MSRYRQANRVAARVIDGSAFVISVDQQTMLELDAVGTFIWGVLESPSSLEDIASAVCAEFEVTADVARRDAEEFVRGLVDRQVVVAVEHAAG